MINFLKKSFISLLTFSWSMWDLAPWTGIKPRPPALGMQSLSHCTAREVLRLIYIWSQINMHESLPRWLSGKESACQVRRCDLIMRVRKIPWEGNGNPLQYSCLENPLDRGEWWTMGSQRVGHDWVSNPHTGGLQSMGLQKSSTRLSNNTTRNANKLHIIPNQKWSHNRLFCKKRKSLTGNPSSQVSWKQENVFLI